MLVLAPRRHGEPNVMYGLAFHHFTSDVLRAHAVMGGVRFTSQRGRVIMAKISCLMKWQSFSLAFFLMETLAAIHDVHSYTIGAAELLPGKLTALRLPDKILRRGGIRIANFTLAGKTCFGFSAAHRLRARSQ